jgi:hypothetical protein
MLAPEKYAPKNNRADALGMRLRVRDCQEAPPRAAEQQPPINLKVLA